MVPARRTLVFLALALVVAACSREAIVAKVGEYQQEREPEKTATSPADSAQAQPSAPGETFEINLAALGQRVPVIMYHDIIARRGRGSVWFDCTRDEFADQMREIQSRGYTPVSLDDLHKHLTTGAPLPDHAIVLTFDDNYQGFYDNAWPILKEYRYPSAMFVHTRYVGDKSGSHPKMSWDTLKELVKSPLFTVGSHTVTHPDLPTLDSEGQRAEMTDSKATLEEKLGKKIDYFAYPEGKNDATSRDLAKEVGYTMSFSIENGPAEESPSIECVNRTIHTRFDKALQECEDAERSIGLANVELKDAPVSYKEQEFGRRKLALIEGGMPMTVTSLSREGVLDFIQRTPGTVAGINGTFFAMAAIKATDNKLVGPSKTVADPLLLPDNEPSRWPKLQNRPMVILGPTRMAIVPFNPPRMNDDDAFKTYMPDYTDAFLGGAWLVHAGVARTREDILRFGSKDAEDPRRRAAFGVTADGQVVAAAAKDSVSSSQFADMLAQAGVQEAVLLDSGFSTSLVYGEKIMASGHSTADMPSRPVPHAILLKGDLDPASKAVADAAVPATDMTAVGSSSSGKHHRRRRRR